MEEMGWKPPRGYNRTRKDYEKLFREYAKPGMLYMDFRKLCPSDPSSRCVGKAFGGSDKVRDFLEGLGIVYKQKFWTYGEILEDAKTHTTYSQWYSTRSHLAAHERGIHHEIAELVGMEYGQDCAEDRS